MWNAAQASAAQRSRGPVRHSRVILVAVPTSCLQPVGMARHLAVLGSAYWLAPSKTDLAVGPWRMSTLSLHRHWCGQRTHSPVETLCFRDGHRRSTRPHALSMAGQARLAGHIYASRTTQRSYSSQRAKHTSPAGRQFYGSPLDIILLYLPSSLVQMEIQVEPLAVTCGDDLLSVALAQVLKVVGWATAVDMERLSTLAVALGVQVGRIKRDRTDGSTSSAILPASDHLGRAAPRCCRCDCASFFTLASELIAGAHRPPNRALPNQSVEGLPCGSDGRSNSTFFQFRSNGITSRSWRSTHLRRQTRLAPGIAMSPTIGAATGFPIRLTGWLQICDGEEQRLAAAHRRSMVVCPTRG